MTIALNNWGAATKLTSSVGVADTVLNITASTGSKFTVAAGTYYYATLKYNSVREFVKVMAQTADTLTVIRAQDNTVAQSFPTGACIVVEWNPAQLCEYVAGCVNGTNTDGITGVNCIDCGTCLTLSNGKITAINGAQSC